MRRFAAGLAGWLAMLVVGGALAAGDGRMSLHLPRPLRVGEAMLVEVEVGVLGAGAQLELHAGSGAPLGTISPHGVKPGRAAGTYVVPVPPEAASDGRLVLRIVVIDASGRPREPRAGEIRSARVVVR